MMKMLVEKGYTSNIKTAKRMIDRMREEVWDPWKRSSASTPSCSQPCADAAPPGHSGVRAGAAGRQGDQGASACLP